MRSKLLEEAMRSRIAAERKLTPEQRIEAHLVHSRLVAELAEAGRKLRQKERSSQNCDHSAPNMSRKVAADSGKD